MDRLKYFVRVFRRHHKTGRHRPKNPDRLVDQAKRLEDELVRKVNSNDN